MIDRRGVLLVQLHPQHQRDDPRLRYILSQFSWWVRIAVAFRHPSWVDDAVFAILDEHEAAYVVMSGAHLPCVLRAPTSWVYVRFHGPDHDHLYAGSCSDAILVWWATRIGEWRRTGLDVYAYVNHDGGGHAVRDAWRLKGMISS